MILPNNVQLRHYTYDAINKPIRRAKTQPEYPAMKPSGFWISVDGNEDGWADWCRDADWRNDWTHAYRVELKPDADLLPLETAMQIREFNDRYSAPIRTGVDVMMIDWAKVADNWDGIFITPYQHSLRFDCEMHWYYGWDCASGCVWNSDVIQSIELEEDLCPSSNT